MYSLWELILVGWGGVLAGIIIMALARAAAGSMAQPDPETTIRWPDLEQGGGSSSATVPTAPAPLGGPER